MAATIRDIKKRTGLSLATISKYLNGGNVLPENRILIEEAINELHYEVNELARGLVTHKTKTIGVLVYDIQCLFVGSMLHYLGMELHKKGYGMLICDSCNDEKLQKENLQFLLSRKVDGILVFAVGMHGKFLHAAKKANVPVVIHLDHGLKKETCLKALELGFSSIMYDCSTDSYEDNVRKVKEMADIAHSYGATIEGELGHVGDNPDSAEGSSHINPADFYTDPKMAKDFVDKTGVDALAIAVGTAHGAYKLPPKLDFERIHTIANTVDVPLVLHGGSGLTDNDFKRAIQEGISKINIFTDINVAAVEAEFCKFETMNKGIIDLIPAAVEAVKQETLKKMMLFSSNGKGTLNQPSQDELVKAVVQEVLRELGRK